MKKRMLSLCLAFVLIISALPITVSAADEVKIDATNFPDPVFRSYVSKNFDLNGDLLLSSKEANAVKVISLAETKVADLKGLTRFPNLTHLFLNGCTKLTRLDYSQKIPNLFVSGCTALTELNCRNGVCTLDVSGCIALKELSCDSSSRGNQLTSLNVSECIALEYLSCEGNLLTNLDVSKCTALQYLFCRNNRLTGLNVSKCVNLTWLYCRQNKLTHLDVSDCVALTRLDCALNELTHLDVNKCTALDLLDYEVNHITAIDVDMEFLSHFPGIQTASLETKNTINGWTADLSELVGTENLSKVELKEGQDWQYDTATGIASYTGEGIPTEVDYIYHGNNVPLNHLIKITLFAKKYVVMKQGAEKAYVNGIIAPTTQYASGYAKMENISGTMQLPLRYIAEVNGFTVNYDENTGKTRVTNPEDGTYLLITPNSTTVTKHTADGAQIGSSDTPLAFSIKNGVTMGPLRFTCEALGMSVSYQETSHGVYVVVSQEAQTDAYVNEKIVMAYWLGL